MTITATRSIPPLSGRAALTGALVDDVCTDICAATISTPAGARVPLAVGA